MGGKPLVVQKKMDTTYLKFYAFVPQSVVSQPFSTSDAEVEHIINFAIAEGRSSYLLRHLPAGIWMWIEAK